MIHDKTGTIRHASCPKRRHFWHPGFVEAHSLGHAVGLREGGGNFGVGGKAGGEVGIIRPGSAGHRDEGGTGNLEADGRKGYRSGGVRLERELERGGRCAGACWMFCDQRYHCNVQCAGESQFAAAAVPVNL